MSSEVPALALATCGPSDDGVVILRASRGDQSPGDPLRLPNLNP